MKSKVKMAVSMLALSALLLTGCAADKPEDNTSPTETAPPESEVPAYSEIASQKPPFTISGMGTQDITIDFPAGFSEPSIVSLSSNGKVNVRELDYDGDNINSMVSLGQGGGTSTVVKYPTEDTPSRTNNFEVIADEETSWAISAESIVGAARNAGNLVTGNSDDVFIYTGDATVVDLVSIGYGNTEVAIIPLDRAESISLGGGGNTRVNRSDTTVISRDTASFNGFAFIVHASNPDTQEWKMVFSKPTFAK